MVFRTEPLCCLEGDGLGMFQGTRQAASHEAGRLQEPACPPRRSPSGSVGGIRESPVGAARSSPQ